MKIGIFGYYNNLNYGDDRLAMAMLKLFGDHDVVFLKHYQPYIRAFLKDFDVLVFGGGGLIFERSGVWNQILTDIRSLRIPTMVIGLGANSYDPSLQPEIDYLIERALVFAVRDEQSKANLGGHDRIEVYPDITWLIPMSPPDSSLFNRRYEISVNATPVPWATFDHEKLFEAIADRRCVIWPLNFRNGIDFELFNGRIAIDRINDEFSSIPIAVSEFTIAMRFHAIIFAMQMVQPFIAVAYDHKVVDLCHENGLEDLCLRLEDIGNVESKLIYMRNNQEAILERIRAARNRNVNDIKPLHSKITNYLERIHSKPSLKNRIKSAICSR
jgi:polysaccharide pyruvyl transferase WcaK-like protein